MNTIFIYTQLKSWLIKQGWTPDEELSNNQYDYYVPPLIKDIRLAEDFRLSISNHTETKEWPENIKMKIANLEVWYKIKRGDLLEQLSEGANG